MHFSPSRRPGKKCFVRNVCGSLQCRKSLQEGASRQAWLKNRVLFQLRRSVRAVATAAAAQREAHTAGGTASAAIATGAPTLLLEKTEPTIDVLGAAARIVDATPGHRHTDHQNADGHNDQRRDHRHQEVQIEPLRNEMGQRHFAVAVPAVRTVRRGRQSTYPAVQRSCAPRAEPTKYFTYATHESTVIRMICGLGFLFVWVGCRCTGCRGRGVGGGERNGNTDKKTDRQADKSKEQHTTKEIGIDRGVVRRGSCGDHMLDVIMLLSGGCQSYCVSVDRRHRPHDHHRRSVEGYFGEELGLVFGLFGEREREIEKHTRISRRTFVMVALATEHADHNDCNDYNEEGGHNGYHQVQIGQDDANGLLRAEFGQFAGRCDRP